MSNFIESIPDNFTSMCSKLKQNVPVVVGVYFAIVLAHFICSNIYPTFCCNMSVWGFIMSPFMAVTPHCEALRWVIHYTGEQIRNAWLWLGGYLIWYFGTNITPFIRNFRENDSSIKQETNNVNRNDIVSADESESEQETNNICDVFSRRKTRSSNNN